jgi:hypothetical protein
MNMLKLSMQQGFHTTIFFSKVYIHNELEKLSDFML